MTQARLLALCVTAALAISTGIGHAESSEPVAKSANAFGVDLYQVLRKRDGNLFFSPFNISTAFSMAASGARGPTAAEMRKVLHQNSGADVDAAIGALSREMVKRQDIQLHFANAVWIDKSFALDAAYRQSMTGSYDSEVRNVDFVRDRDGVRDVINRWVEAKTENKIRDLLPSPVNGPMVITSAVYMMANWVTPFPKQATVDGDFHATQAMTIRMPLMKVKCSLRYLDGGSFQALAIPYHSDLSMVVFLPKRVGGLGAFEQALSAGRLEGWLKALDAQSPVQVNLTLPRYKLDDQFKLKAMLREMGMRQVFTDAADLSGINGVGGLEIEEALHKSMLAVDEEGTEAAAATALLVVITSTQLPAPRLVEFRADHPFYFLIRDDRSGAILFMGRLEAPKPAEP